MEPDGWIDSCVQDLVESVQGGVSVNSESRTARGSEIGVLKTTAVTYGRFLPHEHKVVRPDDVGRARRGVRKGTILFSRMNTAELAGASVYVDADHPALCLPDRIWEIVPRRGVDGRWLYCALSSPAVRDELSSLATGTSGSMKNISQGKLLGLRLSVPPLAEQRKIAWILSSVDETIEKTEAVIAQLDIVKKAMLEELLTRGVQGRRLEPIAEEWRLGRVLPGITMKPSGWQLVRLTDVAKLESGHTPSRRHPEYWDGGVPWVSLHDTGALDGPEISETAQTVSELGIAKSSARLLPRGTVVFSRTATVGKATVLGREMSTSQDFANYVCGPRVHNRYLMHLLRFMQTEWDRLMAGSTHQTIYMPVFRDLQVLLPEIREQERIAEVADAAEARIQAERDSLEPMRAVKASLASELLSGTKRVQPAGAA
jgi:type I restriction enzyme S subunit